MARHDIIQMTVDDCEKAVIERAAAILGISTASFVRSAALAQALPMEECQKVVSKKRSYLTRGIVEGMF